MTDDPEPAHLKSPNAEIDILDEPTARAAFEILRPWFDAYDIVPDDGGRRESRDTRKMGRDTDDPTTPFDVDSSADLQRAYELANGSLSKAAEYFDSPASVVKERMFRDGIYAPAPVDGDPGYRDRERLEEVYAENGYNVSTTADFFDVTGPTIRRWLDRFDIPLHQGSDGENGTTPDGDETVEEMVAEFDIDEGSIGSVDIRDFGHPYTAGNLAAEIARGETFFDIGNRIEKSRADAHSLCSKLGIADRISNGEEVSRKEIQERLEIAMEKADV